MTSKVKGTEGIEFPDSTVQGSAAYTKAQSDGLILGVGQTWQDVKASRVINTLYTNNTGRPIYVACSSTATITGGGAADFVIDAITVMRGGSPGSPSPTISRANFSAIIPAGSTYRMNSVTGTMAVEYWGELR